MRSEVCFKIDMNKIILSSESKCYKTSLFAKETDFILSLDKLILKLWECIIKNVVEIQSLKSQEYQIKCFNANFYFRFGSVCGKNFQPNDVIFTKLTNQNNEKILNENYFYQKLVGLNQLDVIITSSKNKSENFEKIYGVYDADFMNFPQLNKIQQDIVTTENRNIIVQGVAGSGKTNICVSKIIYCACKEYSGKVLYTTYSKSLLNETKDKIEIFKYNLNSFLNKLKKNSLIFLDFNHKKAIENRLNIFFSEEDDENILLKIEKIISYLQNKVDFLLIEELYEVATNIKPEIADEKHFVNIYLKNIGNHTLSTKLEKLKNISSEVIYKEIYGLIFGCFNLSNQKQMLTIAEYAEKRKGSFNSIECECIYSVAKDYLFYLQANNLTDNNFLSRQLIEQKNITPYSLAIIDEVQDFTEVNLCLFKLISRKMFCVGDALQMINPTFFSFAYLKRLMYEEDISKVSKMQNNYRNTKKLQNVIENLNQINTKLFGKHNFVVEGKSVESGINSLCIKVTDKKFINNLKNKAYNGLTIITANIQEKNKLKSFLPKYEILTVAEIKGLERENVILYNLLTGNQSKWNLLINKNLNRKSANENSVFRYYFNLFYVGLSRAKQNVFVVEEQENTLFTMFFNNNFEKLSTERTLETIEQGIPVFEINEKEVKLRINEFLQAGQFENARFLVSKLQDPIDQVGQNEKINIFENYVQHGKNQQAGIMLWKIGFFEDAKKQFMLSNNPELVELVDSCIGNGGKLSMNILPYYVKFKDNPMVTDVIQQVIFEDIEKMEKKQKEIEKFLSEVNKNGK